MVLHLLNGADSALAPVVLIIIALDAYRNHVSKAVELNDMLPVPVNVTYELFVDLRVV